mgnify:CR=1 FL=1
MGMGMPSGSGAMYTPEWQAQYKAFLMPKLTTGSSKATEGLTGGVRLNEEQAKARAAELVAPFAAAHQTFLDMQPKTYTQAKDVASGAVTARGSGAGGKKRKAPILGTDGGSAASLLGA